MIKQESKKCPRCGLTKPADAFGRRRSRTTNGERNAPLRSYCRECDSAATKERYRNDPAVRAKMLRQSREAGRRFAAKRPHYSRVQDANRRSNHGLTITEEDCAEVFANHDNQCAECGGCEGLTLDHIVPLASGGGNTLDNLQLLCADCHRAKTARESRRNNGARKLTAAQTEEIRAATGIKQKHLAAIYGVSPQRISQIRRSVPGSKRVARR